jgi:hypothetical protein
MMSSIGCMPLSILKLQSGLIAASCCADGIRCASVIAQLIGGKRCLNPLKFLIRVVATIPNHQTVVANAIKLERTIWREKKFEN